MAGPMRTKVLPEVQPPRPPNSWILYRAHILKTLPPPGPGEPRRSQSEVSAMVSQMWRDESEATKAHYERLAEEAKEQHKIQFPGYRFKPQKKEEKVRIRELMKQQREEEKLAKKARRVGQSAEPTATRASRSFLMPGAPYYNPHTLYNPVGPSPPLSASSSPRDAIPSPIVLPSMVPALAPANEPVLKLPSPADTEATPKPTPSPSIVPPLPPLSLPTTLEALLNPPSGSSSGAGRCHSEE
ncbi:hypothetical protein CVT26_011705 [Gymnopilus dilepis]|uniref:HMG box domain-containing protein n=1 Tax=Gymnopilus dilepis TaxID=231916 RepID=A0A409WK02_9AGAR|nr:hypothetical protein CVT26_011705 [Gymnopilus dilepis]